MFPDNIHIFKLFSYFFELIFHALCSFLLLVQSCFRS